MNIVQNLVSEACYWYMLQVTRYVSSHPKDASPVSISIIFKRKRRLGECIHLYNVLFRKIMFFLDLARIGREHFNPRNAHVIPQHKWVHPIASTCDTVLRYDLQWQPLIVTNASPSFARWLHVKHTLKYWSIITLIRKIISCNTCRRCCDVLLCEMTYWLQCTTQILSVVQKFVHFIIFLSVGSILSATIFFGKSTFVIYLKNMKMCNISQRFILKSGWAWSGCDTSLSPTYSTIGWEKL
jgi:hypothetical protein